MTSAGGSKKVPSGRLRLPFDECVDTVWAIGSTEVFLLLRRTRGWDAEHYLAWLRRTLTDQLLTAH